MWQVEVLQAFTLRGVLKLETHLGGREKAMKQCLDSHTVIWPLKYREPCWASHLASRLFLPLLFLHMPLSLISKVCYS